MKKILSVPLLMVLLCRPLVADANANDAYFPKDSWRTSSAGRQDLNGVYLDRLHDTYDSRGQIVIIRNGYLVEAKKAVDLDRIEHIHSCTKSVIALLYGMVFGSASVDTPIIGYFPKYGRADNREVTVGHLLSMTSGMDWSDIPNIDSNQLLKEDDWVGYILSKKIVKKPGAQWNYNSGGSQLLSVIMQKKLARPLEDFAKERLFAPLGIRKYDWWKSNDGYLTAGWGLHLSVFDITKIGYLMLNEGRWDGKTVVDRMGTGSPFEEGQNKRCHVLWFPVVGI